MFDFLKKKLNKTIKDASDSIPEEEMTQHDKEFAQDLDSLEEAFDSIEEKYTKDEDTDSNKTDDLAQETKETSEDISEEIDETTSDESNQIQEKSPDNLDTQEEDSSEEEKESENKGRFGFFRRNKKEDESDKKEETSTQESTPDLKTDSLNDDENEVSDDENSSSEDEEEIKTDSQNKGRFGFFRRNKKEDETDKKEETSEEIETTTQEPAEEESSGMFSFITKKTIKEEDVEDILDELMMSLLEGDVAYEVADKIVENVKEDLIGKKIQRRGDMELFTTNALKSAITEIIDNGSYDLLGNIEKAKQNGEPYKIMFVGINGTGKTTTIAKLATYLEKAGYSSVFGASDTFRAGAIEQLEHHAKNLNLKIIKHERNSDPAAVAYDAVEHAKATGKDVVLIDTSGRMQTNANLMDEMKKIKRVSQPDFVMYVGDALMGNDATEQASKFNEVIDIDGIILTKADADAKGGAALSIGHVIHKPILFIGTGQSYDDLMEFKPEWMINLIFDN